MFHPGGGPRQCRRRRGDVVPRRRPPSLEGGFRNPRGVQAAYPRPGFRPPKIPSSMVGISLLHDQDQPLQPRLILVVKVLKEPGIKTPLHDDKHGEESKARGGQDREKEPIGNSDLDHLTRKLMHLSPRAAGSARPGEGSALKPRGASVSIILQRIALAENRLFGALSAFPYFFHIAVIIVCYPIHGMQALRR